MTRDEVRAFDSWAINVLGIPGVVLMENAGKNCADVILERLEDSEAATVLIICGTGNNGGDGYVIARHLLNAGVAVGTIIVGDPDKIKGDAKTNLDILEAMVGEIEAVDPSKASERIAEISEVADMVVDAVFGTGLSGEVRGDYPAVIEAINAAGRPTLAVDIPSGLDCDTGEPLGVAVQAGCTVTFVAVKKGFTQARSKEYTGEVLVAGIGIEPGFDQEQ